MQIANAQPPVRVTGRHVSVTAAIREYAEQKVAHLHLDYPRIIEAHFIFDIEKHRHFAELILHCSNHISIEATSETTDLYASIDEVVAKVAQQMRKHKTRILRQHRPRRHQVRHVEEQVYSPSSLDSVLDETEAELSAHSGANGNGNGHHVVDPEIIKTERYPVKPMYVDEAVLQLEMTQKQQFLVFLNAKSERINVMYRRKDGHFGLIEPVA